MEIKITTENAQVPVTVIAVTGNIDTSTFEPFMSKTRELIDGGARHLLVDLTNVPYMSSAGLRVLNAMFNQLRILYSELSEEEVLQAVNDGKYKSPYLKILNLSKQSKVAFETAGFDMFLETFTDLKTALNSFQ
ncbi:MAG: STAS domain-containing protein [Chloroflexi bacterium]|nr:STAS domain-containing protein [Chloroflexota bacterium]